MKDVARFAIYYPDVPAVLKGVQALRQGFKVVRFENRFRKPTVLGWRDITLLLEETISSGVHEGQRHLIEVQLQLTGYAAAREKAHHYYEIVRERIVTEANVSDPKEQDRLLITLLDAIVGEASRVSGKLLEQNHRVLQDVYASCFGELWAEATCKKRRLPSACAEYDDERP